MIRKLLYLLLPFLLAGGMARACSCVSSGDYFCQSLQNDPTIHSVVMVRKTAAYLHGMKVELLQHLGGTTVPDTFTVWGDNGLLCRLYADNWNVGDTMILAIHTCDLAGNWVLGDSTGVEQSSDYMISVCGTYWLNVVHGQVTGYITSVNLQSVPLSQFLANNCIQFLHIPEAAAPHLAIYPNPATDWLRLVSDVPLDVAYSIVDATGRTVLLGWFTGTSVQADLSSLAPGMYTAVLRSGAVTHTCRFIRN